MTTTGNSQADAARTKAALVLAAVVTLGLSVIALIIFNSENATSVEQMTQAQGAVQAVALPDGVEPPVVDDPGFDVDFEDVVERRGGSFDQGDTDEATVDPVDHVCADGELDNLCRYSSGETIPTPTAQPTPTPQPTKAPAVQPKAPAVQPTRVPAAPPTPTAVDQNEAVTTSVDAPAEATPVQAADTPAQATETPARATETPTGEVPGGGTTTDVPTDQAPADQAPVADAPASADVTYLHSEQPTEDNPNPPLIACWDNGHGSLDCESTPAG